jgi:hypothetical protein
LTFNIEFFESKIGGQKLIFVFGLQMISKRIPAIVFRAINQVLPILVPPKITIIDT